MDALPFVPPPAAEPGPLFEFDAVTVVRAGRPLLAGATGTVPAGGITAVVGPSGSGKSTLLRLCNRLEAATSGNVRHRGRDVRAGDPLALRRQVGMVFQRPTPLPGTVADNLRAGAPGLADAEVAEALDAVGLPPVADRPADGLSGGEAQRMCLARTLLTRPQAVLFDEPTSALDPASTATVERIARRLAARGVPCVWVTHDLAQLRRLADHVLVVIDGCIAQAGPVDAVLAHPTAAVARFLTGTAA